MLEKISNNVASYFVRNGIIKDSDTEIYSFGILAFLEIGINIFTTVILALLFNCILETIGFMLIFIPLRSCAGGYHAKRYISCYLFSIAIFLTIMLITFKIPESIYLYTEIFCAVVTLTVIILLAPIDSESKRATKEENIKYRKLSRFVVSLYAGIIILFAVFSIKSRVIISFSLGGLFCAISLILAINERSRSYEKG